MQDAIYSVPDLCAMEVKVVLDSLKINRMLLDARVAQEDELPTSAKITLLKKAAYCDELIHKLTIDVTNRARGLKLRRLTETEEVGADAPPKADDR